MASSHVETASIIRQRRHVHGNNESEEQQGNLFPLSENIAGSGVFHQNVGKFLWARNYLHGALEAVVQISWIYSVC